LVAFPFEGCNALRSGIARDGIGSGAVTHDVRFEDEGKTATGPEAVIATSRKQSFAAGIYGRRSGAPAASENTFQ